MNPILKKTLLWMPRVLGILFVLITGLFSFDVFDMGLSFWESILVFFMHLLVPTNCTNLVCPSICRIDMFSPM